MHCQSVINCTHTVSQPTKGSSTYTCMASLDIDGQSLKVEVHPIVSITTHKRSEEYTMPLSANGRRLHQKRWSVHGSSAPELTTHQTMPVLIGLIIHVHIRQWCGRIWPLLANVRGSKQIAAHCKVQLVMIHPPTSQ